MHAHMFMHENVYSVSVPRHSPISRKHRKKGKSLSLSRQIIIIIIQTCPASREEGFALLPTDTPTTILSTLYPSISLLLIFSSVTNFATANLYTQSQKNIIRCVGCQEVQYCSTGKEYPSHRIYHTHPSLPCVSTSRDSAII
jgi:hypothetical protein